MRGSRGGRSVVSLGCRRRRQRRHEVGNGDDARAGGEGCLQDVGVRKVPLTIREDGAGRSDPGSAPQPPGPGWQRRRWESRSAGNNTSPRSRRFRQAPRKTCRLSVRSRTYRAWVSTALMRGGRGGELTTVARRHTTRQEARISRLCHPANLEAILQAQAGIR